MLDSLDLMGIWRGWRSDLPNTRIFAFFPMGSINQSEKDKNRNVIYAYRGCFLDIRVHSDKYKKIEISLVVWRLIPKTKFGSRKMCVNIYSMIMLLKWTIQVGMYSSLFAYSIKKKERKKKLRSILWGGIFKPVYGTWNDI